MNGPLNGAGAGSFTSSLIAISDLGRSPGKAVSDLQDTDFSDLLGQQNAVPELLEELKGLLPEQDFSQIEALISSGNGLPSAADQSADLALSFSVTPFPTGASLEVVRQQLAAAQIGGGEHSPALKLTPSEVGLLPALNDANSVLGKSVVPVGTDMTRLLPNGAEQAANGFTTELLKAELETVARSRGAALEETSSAAQLNPMSALRPAEAAIPLRLGATTMPTLETPLTARGWEQSVGERVMWMLGNSMQGASLRINPAHLGPIEIQLSMQQDQATVTFNAQHAVVREALEASIPRLREMFQENNLQLANVNVGQHSGSERQTAGGSADSSSNSGAGDTPDRPDYETGEADSHRVLHSAIDGLVDDYA